MTSVHEDADLLPAALDLAGRMAERPAEALFETKRLLNQVIELDTESAFDRMFEVISERLRSSEQQEALSTYMERLSDRPKRS